MLAKMEQITDTTHSPIVLIHTSTTVITNTRFCFTGQIVAEAGSGAVEPVIADTSQSDAIPFFASAMVTACYSVDDAWIA